MDIRVYRHDLNPDYEHLDSYSVKFAHFKPEVQRAIALAKDAVFVTKNRVTPIDVPPEYVDPLKVIGTQMSNVLFNLSQKDELDAYIKKAAQDLYAKWDGIKS
jgi:hypothetical protein